ncbi:BREX-1 system adenine-specific DNA-methyltransferase PglX [Shewanella sp. SM20]|uniref:BREX-1 system adenine-specific DNA-methyltransferase PglX n=1 Tax=Shewanella sp. SM20 TaxID=2912792 RepID=UPI0021DB5755|nr:BREX-1 system adenine-specific DNA-methyltransferase PglX [Shewanella sp. SM20]MCU8092481.1 BREX-1 system adenine-specific DNA-methyltransferase PglX [Shewanella sp. SM20]
MSQQQNNDMQQHFYRASAADFGKIPGSPVAYWLSHTIADLFSSTEIYEKHFHIKAGICTGKNEDFINLWHEIDFGFLRKSEHGEFKYTPHNKGGEFRKWYGNFDSILKYSQKHLDAMSKNLGFRHDGKEYYFMEHVGWSKITSSKSSFRKYPTGFTFDSAGLGLFCKEEGYLESALAFLNSNISTYILALLNPTLNVTPQILKKIPFTLAPDRALENLQLLVEISKNDWNSYETSWEFPSLPLLYSKNHQPKISAGCQHARSNWLATTLEMQRLEEENNRLFIDGYGLQDELTPEVPLNEITLTCNPHYRYGGNLTDDEREARLQSDTIAELISYAIGCMMGRYSLDRDGLVYAYAGNEGFKALEEEGAYTSFAADDDGILPLTSENWFSDDVAARIEAFVATVWGKESLEENLSFIADSLNLYAVKPVKKGGETARETIRRYLSSQFYKDHLKTYKKRPIYWLFSSGKEKAFECLVYLHRYNESTLPRMRTEYVTPLLGQMASRIERKRMEQTEASTAEAKRIGKEIDSLNKQLTELRAFDDQLKHHADMRITLDLDDGVKVNYGKFGTLLSDVKAITGDKGE